MTLSPSPAAADRGAMDLLVAAALVLAALVVAGSQPTAVRLWRANVHLWDAFLTRDPWDPAVVPDRPR
ncbi:hypothetical protein SAMN06273567_1126 [Geodermatophilus aquaeductus]|uniref:Uncharacterized protein n=2 Tax=Geodermatophilus aquaeductus TaxID=1564161 RepID=A0A521FNV3_9ACTN|nr:hypothetical protein SAMN06273567_1126 [Geodermatophilus aquaeductus]